MPRVLSHTLANMLVHEIQVSLTPFDHCVPRAYYNGAIYLPLKTSVSFGDAFDLLHEALRRAFVQLPWLNGQVRFQEPGTPGWRPGQLELRYSPIKDDSPRPWQLKYNELKTDLTYEDLRELGFPLDGFRDGDIAPAGFFADPKNGRDVFVAQANFLPGGCVLVSAIHHAASDETAFFHFLKLWADHCASMQTGCARPEAFPSGSDDRDILRNIWRREAPVSRTSDIDPETWRLVGLLPTDFQARETACLGVGTSGPPSRPAGPAGSLKAGVFYISPTHLATLRETITQEMGAANGISANDAVCALFWRNLVRVRVAARKKRISVPLTDELSDPEAESSLNMVCDGRPNYSPELPQTYLGNLTFNVQSSLPLNTLISTERTLGTVAATLRRNASRIDSANLQNLYNLLEHLPSYDELIQLKRMRTSTIDGNNMSVSSLINVQMDSICFGDGPVFGNKGFIESARLLMEANNSFTRTCIVLPRNKNGGVEILANLYDEEMEMLMADEEFARYVLCLCWPE
ncbi:hypothetical protein F4780DRAFT_764573 [Xylariomycetidae sp. FL0641]|nr:hypothetical protein F4780DRAFT_764573 [Xylariomycetidae sp. FL0641]